MNYLEAIEIGSRILDANYDICHQCLGVGCLPEDFGIGNSGNPCSACKGTGHISKQGSFNDF